MTRLEKAGLIGALAAVMVLIVSAMRGHGDVMLQAMIVFIVSATIFFLSGRRA